MSTKAAKKAPAKAAKAPMVPKAPKRDIKAPAMKSVPAVTPTAMAGSTGEINSNACSVCKKGLGFLADTCQMCNDYLCPNCLDKKWCKWCAENEEYFCKGCADQQCDKTRGKWHCEEHEDHC